MNNKQLRYRPIGECLHIGTWLYYRWKFTNYRGVLERPTSGDGERWTPEYMTDELRAVACIFFVMRASPQTP